MKKEFICVICPAGCRLIWENGEINGNGCVRGKEYAEVEMTAPKRNVSSTVILKGDSLLTRLPVKTDRPIDKNLVIQAVKQLDKVVVTAPVKVGGIVLENVLGSGVNFVAARSIKEDRRG